MRPLDIRDVEDDDPMGTEQGIERPLARRPNGLPERMFRIMIFMLQALHLAYSMLTMFVHVA